MLIEPSFINFIYLHVYHFFSHNCHHLHVAEPGSVALVRQSFECRPPLPPLPPHDADTRNHHQERCKCGHLRHGDGTRASQSNGTATSHRNTCICKYLKIDMNNEYIILAIITLLNKIIKRRQL